MQTRVSFATVLSMKDEFQLYELGYILAPFVAEEALPDLIVDLRKAIESAGGLLVQEEQPRLRALAYPIGKVIDHKRNIFKEAYFGFLKFQLVPNALAEVKGALDKFSSLLRFLILKTFPVETMRKMQRRIAKPAVVSHEEIDKQIENLFTETA